MTFEEAMETAARGFEGIGVAVLAGGLLWSLALTWLAYRRTRRGRTAYQALRESFGSVLLLGVELMVAADLISTIAVPLTFENVAGLGIIVLIRTFLSFSLQVEIEGMLPWRRAATARRPAGDGDTAA